jgi:hypothetical protein
MERNK